MSLSKDDVKKIAHLARLSLSEEELILYSAQLSNILDFAEQMQQAATDHIEPIAHPLDLGQRLRPDIVTEPDQRKETQIIAPQVEAGLYLVPQVIE